MVQNTTLQRKTPLERIVHRGGRCQDSIEMILLGLAAWGISRSAWPRYLQALILILAIVPIEIILEYSFTSRKPRAASTQREIGRSKSCPKCHTLIKNTGQRELRCSGCSAMLRCSRWNRRIAGILSTAAAVLVCFLLRLSGVWFMVLFIIALLAFECPIETLLDYVFPPGISVSGEVGGPRFLLPS